jgi:pyridoxal phosphate enzyme (YggS family)
MLTNKLQNIRKNLPNHVQLVAVSKTKPITLIQEAYDAGQRDFGENRAQEILEKFTILPKDIHWHFIGNLQTNKVKQIIDKVYLIHSVDRPALFEEIEKQAKKIDKTVDVLLQFHIAQEESKHGFSWDELIDFLNAESFQNATYVKVRGVMGMATFTSNDAQIEQEFKTLKSYFDKLKTSRFANQSDFDVLSMGMSGDYERAIACGSNMVRVGSAIFGGR